MGERSAALRARFTSGLVVVLSPTESSVASNADELLVAIRTKRPPIVVIDQRHPDASRALSELDRLAPRDRPLTIAVVDQITDPIPAARAVVRRDAVEHALIFVERAITVDIQRPVAVDKLLAVSVLDGVLDQVLEAAAEQIADALAADRCVIALRGDSIGGAASGAQTWDSLTWSHTADHCRAAALLGTTLVTDRNGKPESYLAVPLTSSLGTGFLGIVCERARMFPRDQLATLQALARRIAADLGWRSVHQRTVDDLDRRLGDPGLDHVLGVWNRTAAIRLVAMQVSAARRQTTQLAVLVIALRELADINARYGLDFGDLLLRRAGDALRVSVREEDIVARWDGDELLVVLPATNLDGAQRVAERIHVAFRQRALELANGEVMPIEATLGLALLQPGEEAEQLIARASWVANRADAETSIARASTGPVPRMSDPDMRVEVAPSLGGAYRLLHEISRGGMGVVYRAEDLALERPVAIKMLRPDLAEDASFVEGLRQEAAILARLQHPNLVQIYNFGQSGGDSYFVMELVEGEGLQQAWARHRLEGTQMPIADLLIAIEQIGSALDTLHERGVIHRDVKPANIIRDPFRDRSVLVDVGIARRYGQFVEGAGTPGYCAPEVITGGEATPRSDVYGLAATAYALLTLQAPFGEDEGTLGRQVEGADVTPASDHRAELLPVDAVLREALARDLQRRPPTAGAFARALRGAFGPSLAPPSKEASRWIGQTVIPRMRSAPTTRGVVFRSVPRALGVRGAEKLRDAIGGSRPELARAIADVAPLAWVPTQLFRELLDVAPAVVERDGAMLARDIAKATVRASFRRFFPASAATLVPAHTLSAIRSVWGRYQSWGNVAAMPVRPQETVIQIANTPKDPDMCAWTMGMLEQLVVLSGGRSPVVDHEGCEARGDDACLYRVTWT